VPSHTWEKDLEITHIILQRNSTGRLGYLNNIIGISEYDLDVGGNAKAWEWK
jgi:hypothetical protein